MSGPNDSVPRTGRARELLNRQKESWESFRTSCEQLAGAETRSFDFGSFVIQAQLNPARLASVSAKTDDASIRARACFLCDANRPPEQLSLDCGGGFKLLCNPFPILPEHFTIVHSEHLPQRIDHSVGEMLRIAQSIGPEFLVFYNGPQCGASAPDHLHFQAALRAATPLGVEYDQIKQFMGQNKGVQGFVAENYLRYFIGLESSDPVALEAAFASVHRRLACLQPLAHEPMMNLHLWFEDPKWHLVIFPREKHRPASYSDPDPQRLMLSPGAIDMAGVVVVPRDQDFRKLTHEHLRQMYQQTSVARDVFSQIIPFRD